MTHDKINKMYDLLGIKTQTTEGEDLVPHFMNILNELIDREMNQAVQIEMLTDEIEKIQGMLTQVSQRDISRG